jgi:hypothetical protein
MLNMKHNNIFYNYVNYSQSQISVSLLLIIFGFIFHQKWIILFGSFLLIFFLFFFRNCSQIISSCHVVAPSNSKITKIIHNIDPYSKNSGNYTCIKTYLSPFNRHYLVSPVDGVIVNIENYKRKNDLENIRMTVKDKNNHLLYFDQIVKKIGHWR